MDRSCNDMSYSKWMVNNLQASFGTYTAAISGIGGEPEQLHHFKLPLEMNHGMVQAWT